MDDGELFKVQFTASGDGFWTRLKTHPEFLLIAIAPRGLMYEHAVRVSKNFWNMRLERSGRRRTNPFGKRRPEKPDGGRLGVEVFSDTGMNASNRQSLSPPG